MRNINVIVMGKTGSGKSTLINSIFQEEVAPTGVGKRITRKNKLYSKYMMLSNDDGSKMYYRFNMYDTVGLEIDNEITEKTLIDVRKYIDENKTNVLKKDIYVLWFCINSRTHRFETYEYDLLTKLSIDYEIPFLFVFTQSIAEGDNELINEISKYVDDVRSIKVLAKDYKIGEKTIKAYGLKELISLTMNDYKDLKINILSKKIDKLNDNTESIKAYNNLKVKCNKIKNKYIKKAGKVGIVPALCLPFVQGLSIKMISEINNEVGIVNDRNFSNEIFSDIIASLLMAPLLIIPLFSKFAAEGYVETIGDNYIKSILSAFEELSIEEKNNREKLKQYLRNEIKRYKEAQDVQ